MNKPPKQLATQPTTESVNPRPHHSSETSANDELHAGPDDTLLFQGLKTNPALIFVVSERGELEYANDCACEFFGIEQSQVRQISLESLVQNPSLGDLTKHFQNTIISGSATANLALSNRSAQMSQCRCLSSLIKQEKSTSIFNICDQFSDSSQGLGPALGHRARLHRRNQFLTALNSVTSQMMNHLALDDLLQKICELVIELTGADSSFFHLVEETEEALVLTTVAGRHIADKGARLSMGQGLAGKAWASAQVEYTDDYQTVDSRLSGLDDVTQAGAMPVIIKDRVVGVIGLMSSTRKESIAEQLDLVRQFSNLCAIAFENSRLLDNHKLELLRSRTISNLSNAVYESANELDLLRDTSHALMLGFDSMQIDMWELEGEHIKRLLGAWQLHDGQICNRDASDESTERLSAEAWLSSHPVAEHGNSTDEVDEQLLFNDAQLRNDLGISVYLPMIVDSSALGLIHVRRSRYKRSFQRTELNLMNVICAQLATSLHRRKLLKTIEYQAFHDSLTTLPNRLLLDKKLDDFRAQATKSDSVFTILFMDLDGFKNVNDTHGHAVGDQLLIEVVRRAERQLDQKDFMARLGGDEFAILTYPVQSVEFAYARNSVMTNNMLSCLSANFDIYGKRIQISASIGVCVFPQHGMSNSELLSHADSAMYVAKLDGKNAVRLFSNEAT